jgi:signal transduction histidine kinase
VPIRESLRRQREFAADASHELRTPLAIATAAIAELRRSPQDVATVRRSIEDLDAGTDQLRRLVDDLLLLARTDAEAVELESVDSDLAQVAAETVEGLEPVARDRGVKLQLDIEPAPLRGDPQRLGQLVSILVDNAIRHSPPGGLVTVGVRTGRLFVEDSGRGIEAEHLPRVFERFWRAPGAPPGGTGLGLAIAAWIVERHGGTIAAGSPASGSGARFSVTLPTG